MSKEHDDGKIERELTPKGKILTKDLHFWFNKLCATFAIARVTHRMNRWTDLSSWLKRMKGCSSFRVDTLSHFKANLNGILYIDKKITLIIKYFNENLTMKN